MAALTADVVRLCSPTPAKHIGRFDNTPASRTGRANDLLPITKILPESQDPNGLQCLDDDIYSGQRVSVSLRHVGPRTEIAMKNETLRSVPGFS